MKVIFIWLGLLTSIAQSLIEVTPQTYSEARKYKLVAGKTALRVSLTRSMINQLTRGDKSMFVVFSDSSVPSAFTISNKVTSEKKSTFADGISGTFSTNYPSVVVLQPSSSLWRQMESHSEFYINMAGEPDKYVAVAIYYMETARLELGVKYHVYLEGQELFKYTTLVSRLDKPSHHYKFLVTAAIYSGEAPSLSGYGVKSLSTALTPENKDFTLEKYDRQRIGIVFDRESHSYCSSTMCDYKIAVTAQGVTHLQIYSASTIETEVLVVTDNTIGHIKTNSTVKENLYAFKLEDRNTTVFTLIPIQGNAQLLVNPVSAPKQNQDYMYKADGPVGQRIVVSEFDMVGMSLPTNSPMLIAKVFCPSSCKYLLKTQAQLEPILDLTPGFTEAGTGHPGEIKQYLVSKSRFQPSSTAIKQSYFIKLQISSGDGNLHIQVCQQARSCQITKEMFNKTETGLLHIVNKSPIKELKIPLVCGQNRPANLETGYLFSDTCAVAVAIETVPGNASMMSRYEISVDEEETPSVLNMNHQSYIRLLPTQTKKFVLNYHASVSKQLDLTFTIDAKYGSFDCEVTPLSTPASVQRVTIRASHGMISESYRRILFRVPTIGLTESYNIIIKTTDSSAGLILGISEIEHETGPLVTRELKAGVPVTDHIHGNSRTNFYSFKLVHKQGTDYETLKIKVNPIRGKFVMVLRNDDTRPSLDNHQWISYTDEITVTRDDPAFNQESFYVLGVVDLSPPSTSGQHPLFQVQWTTTDKTTMLLPGVFDSGALIATSQCFVAELHPDANEMLVLKGGREDISLYMLLGSTHKTPGPEHNIATCLPEKSGIHLTKTQITSHCEDAFKTLHHCNAYICVYGEKDAKYSLGYTINNQPMLLPSAKVIHGPTPVGDEPLRFIYHPSKDQSVDIEEFGQGVFTVISTKVVETTADNNYVWPKISDNGNHIQGLNNLIHISLSDLSLFTNPVVLISVAKHPAYPTINSVMFNTDRTFSLEAGMELKELVRDVPRTGRAATGEVRYFHFYSHNPNEPIVVTADSLNRADLDIFVSRGKDSRPNSFSYLVRSTTQGSSYVHIQLNDLKSKGFTDFAGYYVVGIKATSDLEFTVRWSYLKSQIVAVSSNVMTTLYLDSEKPAYAKGYTEKDKGVLFLVDAHHSKITVFWNCIPDTTSKSTQNDIELFPNHREHKKKFEISPSSQIRMLRVLPSEMGTCDQGQMSTSYFTFATESENQVQVEFKLIGQSFWSLETLSLNSKTIGSAEQGRDAKYVFRVDADSQTDSRYYFLEIEMFDGTGSLVLLDRAQTYFATESLTTLATVDVPVGITTLSLEKAQGRQFMYPSPGASGGIQTRYVFYGGIHVKCPNVQCTYRLTMRKSDWMTPLEVNTPREAFIPQDGKPETFVYACTGKEAKFDVGLVIENIGHPKVNKLTEAQLKGVLQVFHVKRKEDLNNLLTTSLESNVTHLDPINGRFGLEFPPTVGYFVIRINSFKEYGFSYRIEVSTEHYSRVIQGRQFMGLIDENHQQKTYEFVPYRSDAVFAKMNLCFGNYDVKAFNHDFSASKSLSQLNSGGRFVEIMSSAAHGEPLFLKVEKTTDQKGFKNKFGYLDETKNISIFSLELFESTAWSRIPFSSIAPYDEDMFVDLHSNPPVLRFRPIKVPKEAYIDYQVVYYVVVSKDPEMVTYYLNCDKTYLNKVLKPGFTEDEAVQVYLSDPNIETNYESTSLKPYHSMEIPVTSGHRYFLAVYAQLEIKLQDRLPEKFTSNRLRVVYNSIEFEYRSFFYPVELIAATLGLIGIIVASCCVINTRWIRFFSKKIGGFQGVEHREVDQDLEEYFMRIKDDYQKEENKTKQKKKRRSTKSSPEHSGNVSLDTSSRLDESIVETPATELTETPAASTNTNTKATKTEAEAAQVPHEVEMV